MTRMAATRPGYFAVVGINDLVTFLGEQHLDRSELPPELQAYVDDALVRGAVFEDCKAKLAALTGP